MSDAAQVLSALRIARAELRITLALTTALRVQRRDSIERFRALTSALAVPVDPFGEEAWDGLVDRVIAPVIETVFTELAADAVNAAVTTYLSVDPGRPTPSIPPVDVRPAAQEMVTRVRGLGADAGEQMRRALRGVSPGTDRRDIEAVLRQQFGTAERRATLLARNETVRTANMANLSAMQPVADAGIVDRRSWLTAIDGRERPSHREAHGQVIPFNGSYLVGGYVMKHPHDISAPPQETHNCRCSEIFHLAESEG